MSLTCQIENLRKVENIARPDSDFRRVSGAGLYMKHSFGTVTDLTPSHTSKECLQLAIPYLNILGYITMISNTKLTHRVLQKGLSLCNSQHAIYTFPLVRRVFQNRYLITDQPSSPFPHQTINILPPRTMHPVIVPLIHRLS